MSRLAAVLLLLPILIMGQDFVANYDETKVPDSTLPDPLIMSDGSKVSSAQAWIEKRRPEILALFEELNQGGLTIIMVTHNPEYRERVERVIRVQDGLICADEKVGEGEAACTL